MSKKAISPLIATVLIIGFTIVLAALVMQWGGGLFKSVQDQTSKTSDFKIICSSKLTGMEVTVKDKFVTIDNKNNQDIKGFMIRGYKLDGTVSIYDTIPTSTNLHVACPANDCTLSAYGRKTYTIAAGFTDVGVFPMVLVGTETMTCENEWKVKVSP